jgi:digeranylgeranylglycerophospholipid reductase
MYDLIVIGGSFSGLEAAFTAAASCKVLVVEKRARPGTPINTTGASSVWTLNNLGVFPPEDCIASWIRGTEYIGPDGETATILTRKKRTLVLHPNLFVNWLAGRAQDRGCEILTDTDFRSLSEESPSKPGAFKSRLLVNTSRGQFTARYVIGADGFASNVGRQIGLLSKLRDDDACVGIEYRVKNEGAQDPELVRIYWGRKVAPLGYGWSFPDGPERLRVGLGIPVSTNLRPIDLMNRFMNDHREYQTGILAKEGGVIPTGPPLKTATMGNVLLVGDAGRFCDSLLEAGIDHGMISGELAGTAVARDEPERFDAMWKARLGSVLSRHYKLKKVMYGMSDDDFIDLVGVLNSGLPQIREGPNAGFGDFQFISAFGRAPRYVVRTAWRWFINGLSVDLLNDLLRFAKRSAKEKRRRQARSRVDLPSSGNPTDFANLQAGLRIEDFVQQTGLIDVG